MKKQFSEYLRPELLDYSRFGEVVEGASPAAPGEERADVEKCNIPGLDEQA